MKRKRIRILFGIVAIIIATLVVLMMMKTDTLIHNGGIYANKNEDGNELIHVGLAWSASSVDGTDLRQNR